MTIYTIRDAAMATGKTEQWIRRQIKSGKLPAALVPMPPTGARKRYEIPEHALEAWITRPMENRGRGSHSSHWRIVIRIPARKDALDLLLATVKKHLPYAIITRGERILHNGVE